MEYDYTEYNFEEMMLMHGIGYGNFADIYEEMLDEREHTLLPSVAASLSSIVAGFC